MQIAVILFALAAVAGLYMAVGHFRGKDIGLSTALIHGLFGAAALVVLGAACYRAGFPGLPTAALAVFTAAALGGFALFAMQLRGRRLSSPLLVVHALAAVSAFLLLVYVLAKGA